MYIQAHFLFYTASFYLLNTRNWIKRESESDLLKVNLHSSTFQIYRRNEQRNANNTWTERVEKMQSKKLENVKKWKQNFSIRWHFDILIFFLLKTHRFAYLLRSRFTFM